MKMLISKKFIFLYCMILILFFIIKHFSILNSNKVNQNNVSPTSIHYPKIDQEVIDKLHKDGKVAVMVELIHPPVELMKTDYKQYRQEINKTRDIAISDLNFLPEEFTYVYIFSSAVFTGFIQRETALVKLSNHPSVVSVKIPISVEAN